VPSNPIVQVRGGKLEGQTRRGVAVFRGIPYARAPRGALRWQPPQAALAWPGILDAREYGPSAPQSAPVMLLVRQAIGASDKSQSQDCLNLNVWTPAADRRRRPVLVWIHGGAFILGSGSAGLYNGSHLARDGDVVVVTINYRLGALGFLALHEAFPEQASANLGIRDQIAALEWVRDNIEAFGGDPECVTVFGESAGGMSVGTLLGTPAARGLFQRAILQSGAAHNVSTSDQAARVTDAFLEELGGGDLALLERMSVSRLLGAQRRTSLRMGIGHGVLPWQPCVDDDLIPTPPLEAIGKGLSREVPVLIGSNRDEWKLFMLGDRKARELDEAGLRRRFVRALPGEDDSGRSFADRAFEAYLGAIGSRGHGTPGDVWEAFQSDKIFHHPAHRLAEVQSAHNPRTYAYQFGWAPPIQRQRIGACHGIEIPFVFGTLREPWLRPLLAFAPQARELSEHVQRAWLEFARTGVPAHDGLPAWPAYSADSRSTLLFTRRSRVENDPFATAMRFWDEIEARND